MEQSKADSFTAFLKEKQRLKAMQQPQQGATPLSLLTALAAAVESLREEMKADAAAPGTKLLS